MEIFINGKAADITLETEKTVGDILSGLEQWLRGSGNRLSGLVLDGETIGSGGLEKSFARDISGIKRMDILVSAWPELAAEALVELGKSCALFASASFEERQELCARWEQSPAAAFLKAEIPDIAHVAQSAFSLEGLPPEDLSLLADERFRELQNPQKEILAQEETVLNIVSRMEGLPLDIQTGKDGRAAQTMQLFSLTGEKLFRLLSMLKNHGFSMDTFAVDGLPVRQFTDEFGAALKELCSAYDTQDSVLVGDLAEYELAPRLTKLYIALKDAALVPSL